MVDDRFWALIDASRNGFDPEHPQGNQARQAGQLREILAGMDPDEVVGFKWTFVRLMQAAYHWDLWGAAYIIEGGCSDDAFSYFRSWLISMGRGVYEAALRDAESLVDVAQAPGVEIASFEDFQYIPSEIYERATGREMPSSGMAHPSEPQGTPWSEDGDDLERRFPKLWARFGES